jgi:hypothetical protein
MIVKKNAILDTNVQLNKITNASDFICFFKGTVPFPEQEPVPHQNLFSKT